MQRYCLKKKDYKRFLVKNESGLVTKKIIIGFFFNFNFLIVFLVKALIIILVDQNRKMYIFYKKKIGS